MRHSTRCSSHHAQVRVSDRSPLPRRRGELPVREGLNLKQGQDNVSLLRRRFVCWVRYCCLSQGGVFFGSSRGTLVKSSKMPRALPPHHRRGHRIHSRQCVRLIRQISCGSSLYLLTTRTRGTLVQAKRDTALSPGRQLKRVSSSAKRRRRCQILHCSVSRRSWTMSGRSRARRTVRCEGCCGLFSLESKRRS